MTIKLLSDTALLLEIRSLPGEESWERVQRIVTVLAKQRWPELIEVVPGLSSVALYLHRRASWPEMASRVERVLQAEEGIDQALPARSPQVVKVRYGGAEGADLARVAQHAGLSPEAVVARHAAGRYRVMALGFAPGFPYLSGLDASLQCPRLATPRLRIPAGSIGIGGDQTGVYPVAMPGGWNLIGRTGQTLFDSRKAVPAMLRVGDAVKFEPVDSWESSPGPDPHSDPVDSAGIIKVLEPGIQTTVQDQGRWGWQDAGVTPGGIMDQRSWRVANLLVGNPPEAAGLEWVLRGPRLRFKEARLMVVTGAKVAGVAFAKPTLVRADEVLDLSRVQGGGRGLLAISGGIEVPIRLGSRATHLDGGFGGWRGRALQRGDQLGLGAARAIQARPGWWIDPSWVGGFGAPLTTLRILQGPEAGNFASTGWRQLVSRPFEICSDSNRMGLRLKGPRLTSDAPAEMVSGPVAMGTIQVPPDGQPIVLMADRQTLGGYPRIGSVISADLAALAQAPLGGQIQFEETTLDEAERLRRDEERDLSLLQAAVSDRLTFQT